MCVRLEVQKHGTLGYAHGAAPCNIYSGIGPPINTETVYYGWPEEMSILCCQEGKRHLRDRKFILNDDRARETQRVE